MYIPSEIRKLTDSVFIQVHQGCHNYFANCPDTASKNPNTNPKNPNMIIFRIPTKKGQVGEKFDWLG